jgi:hypothetical protein
LRDRVQQHISVMYPQEDPLNAPLDGLADELIDVMRSARTELQTPQPFTSTTGTRPTPWSSPTATAMLAPDEKLPFGNA